MLDTYFKDETETIQYVLFPGKLTVIVGQVGSGKTSFLSALLGEMHIVTGEVKWSRYK